MNTKKQLTFIFFILILTFQLNAQSASRFPIQPGSVWRINYEYSSYDGDFVHQMGDEEYKYFLDGDTVVGGKTYFKLFKTGLLFLETPMDINHKYMGAIRDSADRFFYLENKKAKEVLLCNFAANVGETICHTESGMDYIVGEIDTLENGRKKFYIDIITVNCGSANALIEGIGWLGGLLEGNACYSHPGIRGSYLLCYSENGVPVYETEISRGEKKLTCNTDITSVKQPILSSKPEITILPDRRLDICFPQGSNDMYSVKVFTIQGKRLTQLTTELPGIIDLKALGNGLFLIRISNKQMEYSAKFMF